MDKEKLVKKIFEVNSRLICFLRHHVQEKSGLSMAQYRVLAWLKHRGPALSSELAEAQAVSLPAMSKTVDGLVKKGFIARSARQGDRRKQELRLEAKGKKAFESIEAQVHGQITEKVGKISAEQRQALDQSLALLESVFAEKEKP